MNPWQTELQYHAIYYWTGLIGVALVMGTFACAVLVVRKSIRKADWELRDPLFLASVAAVAALIGDASNPYLQPPGHMWIVFFPLMISFAVLRKPSPTTKGVVMSRAAN